MGATAEAPPATTDGVGPATVSGGPRVGRPGHRGGGWAVVAVVVVYVALAVLFYGRVWTSSPSGVVQPGGDQAATVWFLEWVPYALLHGHDPFFSTFVNAPFGVNLLINTSVPLLGLLGAPVTLAFGPVATYNVLCTLALAGSATAGYVFVRRWVTWRPAAFIGGLLYGFSPYQIAQSEGHLNLTFVVLPPLVMLAVHKLLVRQRGRPGRWGVVLGLLVVGQYFVSSEVLVSTVVMAVVATVAAAVVGHRSLRSHLRHAATGLAWAVGVAVVLLAWPVWFTLRGPGSIRGPIQLVPQAYRADLLGPVVPSHFVWLAPSSLVRVSDAFANSITENGSYLGVVLLVVLAVGTVVLWRRSAPARVAAITGAVAFVISLGGGLVIRHAPSALPGGFPLPERLFAKLPLLSNTVPARYSLYVTLFAGLLLALIVDQVRASLVARLRPGGERHVHHRRRSGAWASSGVPLALAGACLVPLIPSGLFAGLAPVDAPAVLTSSTSPLPKGATTLLYPYPSGSTPQGQLWQAVSRMRFRTPGGYFLVPFGPDHDIGFSTVVGYGTGTLTAQTLIALYAGHPPAETPSLRAALRAQLRAWDVTDVVETATDDPDPARAVAFLSWLTGRPPTVEAGGRAWLHVDFR